MAISCSDGLSAACFNLWHEEDSWIGAKAKTKKYRTAIDVTFDHLVLNFQLAAPRLRRGVGRNSDAAAIGIQLKLERRASAGNLEDGYINLARNIQSSHRLQGLAALTRLVGIDLL